MIDNSKENLYAKMDIQKEKCRKKGFREEDTKILGMFALTKNAVETFGSSEKAFEYLIELIDKHNNAQEIIDIFGTAIGIE